MATELVSTDIPTARPNALRSNPRSADDHTEVRLYFVTDCVFAKGFWILRLIEWTTVLMAAAIVRQST